MQGEWQAGFGRMVWNSCVNSDWVWSVKPDFQIRQPIDTGIFGRELRALLRREILASRAMVVLMVAFRRLSSGPQGGENLAKQGFQSWDRGTNHTGGKFRVRPAQECDRVPGEICRLA
jgi:hypothetical protein